MSLLDQPQYGTLCVDVLQAILCMWNIGYLIWKYHVGDKVEVGEG